MGQNRAAKRRASGPVVEEMVERTQDSYGKDGREICFLFRDIILKMFCMAKYLTDINIWRRKRFYATAVKGKRYRQFLKISDTIKPDFLYTDEGMIQ